MVETKSTNMPKVSIIVPVYNVEAYIHRCIDSILAQTFTDWELLLIDDGSPDRSGEICDEYAQKDKRIRVFHKNNGGVSSARNLGLNNACGDWTTFVDSDDFLDRTSLSKMFGLTNHYDSDLFCFKYRISNGVKCNKSLNDCELEKTTVSKISKDTMIKDILTYQTNCGPFAKLFRTEKLKKHSFDETLKIGEDLLLNLTYISDLQKSIIYSETSVYNYFMNTQSVMHSKNLTGEYAMLSKKVARFFASDTIYAKHINIFKMINLFQSYATRCKCPSYTDTELMRSWNNEVLTQDINPILFQFMKDSRVTYLLAWGRLKFKYIKHHVKVVLLKIV